MQVCASHTVHARPCDEVGECCGWWREVSAAIYETPETSWVQLSLRLWNWSFLATSHRFQTSPCRVSGSWKLGFGWRHSPEMLVLSMESPDEQMQQVAWSPEESGVPGVNRKP